MTLEIETKKRRNRNMKNQATERRKPSLVENVDLY